MLILTYYDTFAITKNVRSYKKKSKASKENYRPLSILRYVYIIKCNNILTIHFRNINVVLARVILAALFFINFFFS